ncbi:hypothetical protein BTHE68_71440 (plasmid) [Burkholderia sp. THE68]|uniref:hypothetical protein n=1 Tax=Burkholderia sp. THE68 TaxID=758782 RepID=UPI001317825D|nr:hypothetical protein [Burkholderia sp. THE68]BBU33410.1 hypothetical protein BTHE68_71440 [Burkholderia sp. THE68]
MFTKLFSARKQTKIGDLQILFFVDAAPHGSHGKIRVSHRKLGLVERAVNWVAVGVTTAPEPTPSLLEHIWREAYAQGYVPHTLVGCLEDNLPVAAPAEDAVPERGVPAVFRQAHANVIGHKSLGFDNAMRLAAAQSAA